MHSCENLVVAGYALLLSLPGCIDSCSNTAYVAQHIYEANAVKKEQKTAGPIYPCRLLVQRVGGLRFLAPTEAGPHPWTHSHMVL